MALVRQLVKIIDKAVHRDGNIANDGVMYVPEPATRGEVKGNSRPGRTWGALTPSVFTHSGRSGALRARGAQLIRDRSAVQRELPVRLPTSQQAHSQA